MFYRIVIGNAGSDEKSIYIPCFLVGLMDSHPEALEMRVARCAWNAMAPERKLWMIELHILGEFYHMTAIFH